MGGKHGSGKLKKLLKDANNQDLLKFLIRLHHVGDWPDSKKRTSHMYTTQMPGEDRDPNQLILQLSEIGFLEHDKGGKVKWNRSLINNLMKAVPTSFKNEAKLPESCQMKQTTAAGDQAPIVRRSTSKSESAVSDGSQTFILENQKEFKLSNGAKCCLVDTVAKLESAIASDSQLRESANNETEEQSSVIVAIDCEGVPESLELLQVATASAVYVFDGQSIGARALCEALQPMLVSSFVVKVLHDLRQDVRALKDWGSVRIANVVDSQLLGEHVFGDFSLGFNALMKKMEVQEHPTKGFMHGKMNADEDFWARRPLKKYDIEYAALDASLLLEATPRMIDSLPGGKNDLKRLIEASQERMATSIAHGGARSIAFDLSRDYAISSAELIRVFRPQEAVFGKPLLVQSEMSEVIRVLPPALRAKFDTEPPAKKSRLSLFSGMNKESAAATSNISAPEIDLKFVSDINVDIGSRPQCWLKGKRIFLVDDVDTLAQTEDIKQIVAKLGDIGTDNRAGLDRQLHRFSVIRARDDSISGVTIRFGRWITGNADILTDLLLGSDKSILFLGEPGSGKTTVVREATRILAQEHNVVVVDTSNEIAGDGMMKHECIGHARRMMVPSLDKQSDVMIECVQNHTPSSMVIDEIGRPKEVSAARTVKQRGVRIIASAHGDLRKLVKNRELKGLIGGVEQVTMGDDMAKEEAKRRQAMLKGDGTGTVFSVSKTKSQRAGEPTFDVIVEVRRGAFHEWRIVKNAAEAVDRILEGRMYKAELRTRDPETGAMFLDFVHA